MERVKNGQWVARQIGANPLAAGNPDANGWLGASAGIAFSGEHSIYVGDGNSGRISLFDSSGDWRRAIDINQGGYHDSYAGDLALDGDRGILYVADPANFRVAAVDVKSRQVLASVKTGRLPFAMTLSPERHRLYVTNIGMLEYRAIPGANASEARTTGLPFPAFGFPGDEAIHGAERQMPGGRKAAVPGVGDANAPEANSVSIIDVSNPAAPKVIAVVRTGEPVGNGHWGGSSPSAVVAGSDRVFVSNTGDDSISVIDAISNRVVSEIPIRIPGLEQLRGVAPMGLAYDKPGGRLLAAEAGINAVAVIDARQNRVLGHVPAAWFPTRVAIQGDMALVANAKGHGVGPDSGQLAPAQMYQGSVSVFSIPSGAELAEQTAVVIRANGFTAGRQTGEPLPRGIRHVVLIVKESRSYDEVLGDLAEASNGHPAGEAQLARLGSAGIVDGGKQRLSLKDVNVTPNHHAIARRWTVADNFYADGDNPVEGHHWLAGIYPNAWMESSALAAYGNAREFRLSDAPGRLAFAGSNVSALPEDVGAAGDIWRHLEAHGISFYSFGEGFDLPGAAQQRGMDGVGARFLTNMPMSGPLYQRTSREYAGFNLAIPDQTRASEFIHEVDAKFASKGADLPRLVVIWLPGDALSAPRPEDGYPYAESFMADNDLALGRIMQYLSHSSWWKDMAVLITESSAVGGVDHIDANRTLLMVAGPWAKKNYASHVNASYPSLLKTVFELLGAPPLNLFDAAAADLRDCFTASPDLAPYTAEPVDRRIFEAKR
jgi:YVTN family beta-propeller protein